MLDYLIRNASVLDGTGREAEKKDIGIRDGKITENTSCEAREVIDAEGLTLTPGFIDVHAHSDVFLFAEPTCENKLLQGITTEIAGQCGLSPAPFNPEFEKQYNSYAKAQGAPVYPNIQKITGMAALMDTIDAIKPGINMALFAAQGMIRLAAMGLSPAPAGKKEIDRMAGYLREAMEAGALGFSTGLMYAPGSFSSKEELKELAGTNAAAGGTYTSHIRNQGGGLIDSVQEAIEIAEAGNMSVNISHHKAVGRGNWGAVRTTSEMIRNCGGTHDVYPYTASSTTLTATFPPSLMKKGMEYILQNLPDRGFREELEQSIFEPAEEWDNDVLECGYGGILIVSAPKTPDALGKTIAEYASLKGLRPFDAYCEILEQNNLAVSDICFSMSEEDVSFLLQDPLCMFGTDSLYIKGFMDMTHPRATGTFPKILSEYVREKKLISLPEAIRKMTSFPAERYGLKGKGLIQEGMDADLVLFDPETIAAGGTYQQPLLPNTGIAYVFVNGKTAVVNGAATGTRNGRVVRRS